MITWRDKILNHFQPGQSRLTLAADPDGLLTEAGMLAAIRARGFELMTFEDPVAFRYAYEAQYRQFWDEGQTTPLVVVLRSARSPLSDLPFDLLQVGRSLTFALYDLFPQLNYPVIAGLEQAHFDALDAACQSLAPGVRLTERQTRALVLTHGFGLVPELLKTPVDLLKALLSLHARQVQLPERLIAELREWLTPDPAWVGWPALERLCDRESFLRFLQEEWGRFIATLAGTSPQSVLTALQDAGLTDPDAAPYRVPFAHPDVRAYIDTLFLDGLLKPVNAPYAALLPDWTRPGVLHDPQADALRRWRNGQRKFAAALPSADATHRDWQQAAQQWADLIGGRWTLDAALDPADRHTWDELQATVEQAFGQWLLNRYGTLHNLPYLPQPVMVHQIPRFLASQRQQRALPKIALLVLDGLALDQWLLLRESLETTDPAWRFQETALFAWLPTLTAISRQAIFAGAPPFYFPDSLTTTAKEKAHWQRFWEDQGLAAHQVKLITSLDGSQDPQLDAALAQSQLAVLGLVWNRIDDIMHGMQLAMAGMHNQVRLWAAQGHLHQLLRRLDDAGFAIWLTADHGNVAATGIGQPREGILVETKGQRARIYDQALFLEEVAQKFPQAVRWPGYGLPPNQQVLLAGGLTAFTHVGDQVVAHGGMALEEVMAPFIAIRRER